MTSEVKRLQAAFLRKEEKQKYLSNLEAMRSQGRVTDEQYASLKTGYQQDMTAAVTEIANVKSQLKLQLQTAEQNLNSLKTEQESLRLRRDIGELPPETYQNSEQKLLRKIGSAQKDIADLQRLIGAKQSIELGAAAIVTGERAFRGPSKRGPLQWITLIWGILCVMGMFVAFAPFIGLLFIIPYFLFAGMGLLISLITIFLTKGSKGFSVAGAIMCLGAPLAGIIAWAAFGLSLGGLG
jgi:hypothetical protein